MNRLLLFTNFRSVSLSEGKKSFLLYWHQKENFPPRNKEKKNNKKNHFPSDVSHKISFIMVSEKYDSFHFAIPTFTRSIIRKSNVYWWFRGVIFWLVIDFVWDLFMIEIPAAPGSFTFPNKVSLWLHPTR